MSHAGTGRPPAAPPERQETRVFVGAVVRRGREILLVRQSAGHPLASRWTVPWGGVERGESPLAAALRETREEGGIDAEAEGLLGVQELPSPQAGAIALVYLCRHRSGTPEPRGRETDAARYYSRHALDALAEPIEPWSAWLVRRVFEGRYTLTPAAPDSPLQALGAFV